MNSCGRSFAEDLLSGYVDEALTQGDEQRVRLHLEDCTGCARLVQDMKENREVTMTTQFKTPADDQWDERPRGLFSTLSFGVGWFIIAIWVAVTASFGLWQLATGPEDLLAKLLIFSGLSAVGLLFLSVLIDRIKTLKTDRYRKVQK
jgi:hypothetical protein